MLHPAANLETVMFAGIPAHAREFRRVAKLTNQRLGDFRSDSRATSNDNDVGNLVTFRTDRCASWL